MKHPITDDMLVNHIAALAKTGAGKTYFAKGVIERLLARGDRVCIVDPKNAWWGLKSAADGKSPGFEIVVFGGPNGDMPLLASHGKILGEAVANGDMSCIICTKGMVESDRIKFLTDFFQTLDRVNTEPLHLVLDEAHMMAPQKPLGEMARLTHWTTELVTGGRGMGFRIMLLSQRPARLNKDVLTQCETLVAMRMTGPQDRNQVRAWIEDQADVEKGKEIVASLTGLKNGEGWVWSPEIGVLERVKFPLITTYDNSATKRDKGADSRAKLAPVDLKALEARLGQAADEIKAKDPTELRKRITELERELTAKKQAVAAPVDTSAIEDRSYQRGWNDATRQYADRIAVYAKAMDSIGKTVASMPTEPVQMTTQSSSRPGFTSPFVAQAMDHIGSGRAQTIKQAVALVASRDDMPEGLTRPQKRVLDAVEWWRHAGKNTPTRAMVAAVAGYAPGSGNFNNLIGQLVGAGFIELPGAGLVGLTDMGRAVSAAIMAVDCGALHDRIQEVLTAPQWKVLAPVMDQYPDAVTREKAAELSGYAASSGNFNNLLGQLSTLEMLEKPQAGSVRAASWLFV